MLDAVVYINMAEEDENISNIFQFCY